MSYFNFVAIIMSILVFTLFMLFISKNSSPIYSLLLLFLSCFFSFITIYFYSSYCFMGFLLILCTLGGVVIVFSFVLMELPIGLVGFLSYFMVLFFVLLYMVMFSFEFSSSSVMLMGNLKISILFMMLFILNYSLTSLNISIPYSNFKMKKI